MGGVSLAYYISLKGNYYLTPQMVLEGVGLVMSMCIYVVLSKILLNLEDQNDKKNR